MYTPIPPENKAKMAIRRQLVRRDCNSHCRVYLSRYPVMLISRSSASTIALRAVQTADEIIRLTTQKATDTMFEAPTLCHVRREWRAYLLAERRTRAGCNCTQCGQFLSSTQSQRRLQGVQAGGRSVQEVPAGVTENQLLRKVDAGLLCHPWLSVHVR